MSDKIENKKFYVTMTDTFMSGWGMAEGKINKLVIGCDTEEEAKIVQDNAENRNDQKYINIAYKKPYYSPSKYEVSYHDKNSYGCWFKNNYFRNQKLRMAE